MSAISNKSQILLQEFFLYLSISNFYYISIVKNFEKKHNFIITFKKREQNQI